MKIRTGGSKIGGWVPDESYVFSLTRKSNLQQ